MKISFNDLLKIIQEVGTLADINSINPDISLRDQKIDSLDMANIFLILQERYGVKITLEEADKLNTLNDILKHINHTKNNSN